MAGKNRIFFGTGALLSGATTALTTLCCVGPIAAGALGMGAAAFGARLEPYRPYLLVLTAAFLGFAFYSVYRPDRQCADGAACATPRGQRVQRLLVWLIAVVALVMATSSYWYSLYVFLTL